MSNLSQSGVSLIASLVTMVIGLLITCFLFEAYLIYQKNCRVQAALQQIQYAAGKTIEILNSEIHRAGYIGCMKLTDKNPIVVEAEDSLGNQNKLLIQDNQLLVRYMETPHAVLLKSADRGRILHLSKEVIFSMGDRLVLADCSHAEIVQVKESTSFKNEQILLLTEDLRYEYLPFTEIGYLRKVTYFSAKTKRKYTDGSPVYALFSKQNNQPRIELLEGIKQMRFWVTEQRDQHIFNVKPEDVEDGATVVGVGIDLELHVPPLTKNWHAYVALQ